MLSLNVIERQFHAGRFDALLQALAANGLPLPLPLRIRLSDSPVPALALALRRVIELTYGPTPLSRRMLQALLQAQQPDGSFDADPLATACAAAALGRVLADQRGTADTEVVEARHRALASLAQHQQPDGLFAGPSDRTTQDRAMTSAFILSLLAGDAEFRAAVRLADLLDWFEEHSRRLDRDTEQLWQLARLDAAADGHELRTPAMAA
jgi:hypothetical protein